jgi:CelD/BcsL family acetyltransferase involved in cellulose biosynthesis
MHTEIISDPEKFAALKDEWNLLVEKDPASNIFLTHEWLNSWWETFGEGRELFIVLCRTGKDGRVVGILPAFRESSAGLRPRRTVRLLGSQYVSSDFLGVLVDPAAQSEALKGIIEALHHCDPSWDLLDLSDLDAKGHLPPQIARSFGDISRHRLIAVPGEICPSLLLPGDWDTYLRNLSAKMRSNIRYFRKALERSGSVEIEEIDSQETIDDALSEVMRLRENWIKARGYASPCPFPLYADFHRRLWKRLLHQGRVSIRFLRFDGCRIAFAYLLRHAGNTYFYQTAFDQSYARLSVGSVLLSHVLEHEISRGCTRFEFLRGNEEYKYKWGKVEQRELVRVKVYNSTGAGRLSYGVDKALKNTRHIVRGIRARVSEK